MKKWTLLFTLLFTVIFSQYAFADQILDDELFYAANIGNIEQTSRALMDGADPDVANPETGFSALMASCLFTDQSITRMLLNSGADVNKRTTTGESALYYAVEKDNLNLVTLLLGYGADASIVTTNGTNLYQIARRNKNQMIMTLLAKAQNKITLATYDEIPCETSLVWLDEIKILRARQEGESLSRTEHPRSILLYQLSFNAVQNLIDEQILRKSPHPGVALITPYSLLRYNYAVADRKDKELPLETVSIINRNKDVVWLWVRPTKEQPYVDNVTVKIGDDSFPYLSKEQYNLKLLTEAKMPVQDVWPFPIDLFTARNPLTEIIVSYPDGKYHTIKIKAEDFNRVPLK